MAISKEQIFAVADELDATGQNPTLANVRKQLGSGSFTTISEAMNEWRAHQASQAAPIREPAPQAVTDKLAVLGGDLWAVALEMAHTRLAAEREALETVRQETEAARKEAAELADQLTDELDEAKARIATMEAVGAAAKDETDELRGKLSAASERAAMAEARAGELRTELDHAQEEARQARAELVKLQVKAEVADQANQEQRKTMAIEAHRQAERLTAAKGARDQAKRDTALAREEAATLRGRLEALETVMAQGRPTDPASSERKKT